METIRKQTKNGPCAKSKPNAPSSCHASGLNAPVPRIRSCVFYPITTSKTTCAHYILFLGGTARAPTCFVCASAERFNFAFHVRSLIAGPWCCDAYPPTDMIGRAIGEVKEGPTRLHGANLTHFDVQLVQLVQHPPTTCNKNAYNLYNL